MRFHTYIGWGVPESAPIWTNHDHYTRVMVNGVVLKGDFGPETNLFN